MSTVVGNDPRSGEPVGLPVEETSTESLSEILLAAARDSRACSTATVEDRVRWLVETSAALESERDRLVTLADEETALGGVRLGFELDRTIGQIQLFVDVLNEGSFRGVVIDDADSDSRPAPRPELRRGLRALGPVGVWTASNFPFAFGVAGGDTISALAAGCPVVVKAHPSQPGLSMALGGVVSSALRRAGAPVGAFALVQGMAAGARLIVDRRIKGAAFTGSTRGGRALFDLASARPDPIPFFGELGSINAVIVTPAAAAARPQEIAEGLVASATLGVGQFCTKPGLVFVPAACDIPERAANLIRVSSPGPMLNVAMRNSFMEGVNERASIAGVSASESDQPIPEGGNWVRPLILATSMATYLGNRALFAEECFGPVSVLVEYQTTQELQVAVADLPGGLTATIHGDEEDEGDIPLCLELRRALEESAGRLIWNGWPTGVAVAWGMQHGGPYPAATVASATSVGASSILRFLRPVTFQSFPSCLTPEHLQDANLRGVVRHNGKPDLRP